MEIRKIASRIESELIKNVGNDSEMYSELNSKQREIIHKIYGIFVDYSKLLESVQVDYEKSYIAEKTDERVINPAKHFISPAITLVTTLLGGLGGYFLSKNIWITVGCAVLFFSLGEAGRFFIFDKRISEQSTDNERQCSVKMTADLSDEVLNTNVEDIKSSVQEIMRLIEVYTRPVDAGHDITKDSSFAEWVQKMMSVVQYVEDRQAKVLLTGELITKLASMGIYVIDKFEVDEEGTIKTEIPDMFVVKRLGKNEKPEVVLPAVCYKEKVLAKGEIIY